MKGEIVRKLIEVEIRLVFLSIAKPQKDWGQEKETVWFSRKQKKIS